MLNLQDARTQLVLKGCYLHGIPHSAAVFVEAGSLRMEGSHSCRLIPLSLRAYNKILTRPAYAVQHTMLVPSGHRTGLLQTGRGEGWCV